MKTPLSDQNPNTKSALYLHVRKENIHRNIKEFTGANKEKYGALAYISRKEHQSLAEVSMMN